MRIWESFPTKQIFGYSALEQILLVNTGEFS